MQCAEVKTKITVQRYRSCANTCVVEQVAVCNHSTTLPLINVAQPSLRTDYAWEHSISSRFTSANLPQYELPNLQGWRTKDVFFYTSSALYWVVLRQQFFSLSDFRLLAQLCELLPVHDPRCCGERRDKGHHHSNARTQCKTEHKAKSTSESLTTTDHGDTAAPRRTRP